MPPRRKGAAADAAVTATAPMKPLRILVATAILLLLLALAAAAYFAVTFDPNRYKSDIERYVKNSTGRTLELEGPVAISLWPGIGISIGRATLSNANEDGAFARMGGAHVSFDILPLLSRRIVVDEMQITGLHATVVRYADGRTNVDDFLRSQAQPSFVLDIGGLRLRDGGIEVVDLATGRRVSLSGLDATTGRIARGAPLRIEVSGTARSDAPHLDAKLTLQTLAAYDTVTQEWALQDIAARMRGDAAGLRDAAVEMSGRIAVNARTHAVHAENLRVAAKSVFAPGKLGVELTIPALQASDERWSAQGVKLQASLEASRSTTEILLDAPHYTGSATLWKSAPVKLAITYRGPETHLVTQIAAAFSGDFRTGRIDMPDLTTTFDLETNVLRSKRIAGELSGTASIDLVQQDARVQLAGRVAESRIKARLDVAPLAPPAIVCDIDVDRLDLNRYLPAASRAPSRERLLDLSSLRPLRASGTVRVGALTISQVTVKNARLVLARD